jgi:NAD(P)-dependent dehydrogenase (short-subunit alcohol dehydrogenase family)
MRHCSDNMSRCSSGIGKALVHELQLQGQSSHTVEYATAEEVAATGQLLYSINEDYFSNTNQGLKVFAGSRSIGSLSALNITGVEPIELDPADPDSIAKARDEVSKRTGGKLDILINNAYASRSFRSRLLADLRIRSGQCNIPLLAFLKHVEVNDAEGLVAQGSNLLPSKPNWIGSRPCLTSISSA